MDAMRDAFRNIKAALQAPSDADKQKYGGYVDTLIAAATQAKNFEPEKTSTLPEADRAQFLADYRQSMDALIALFEQLKSQLSAGDWDGARAQMRLIGDAQADGHEKFRPEES
jgi:soluble cytochrome b562